MGEVEGYNVGGTKRGREGGRLLPQSRPLRRETTLFYRRFVILVALVETPIPMFNA
jgi:hypothetical protein